MLLFLALCFVGVAVGGFTAFVIFWPLTLVHLRDRHPETADGFGEGAFLRPEALRWLLGGGYRALGDGALSGLATPARIALAVLGLGAGMAGLLWLWSLVAP